MANICQVGCDETANTGFVTLSKYVDFSVDWGLLKIAYIKSIVT